MDQGIIRAPQENAREATAAEMAEAVGVARSDLVTDATVQPLDQFGYDRRSYSHANR